MKKEKAESTTQPTEKSSNVAVLEEIRMTPWSLAEKLSQDSVLEIQEGQKLVIHSIDLSDFLAAAGSTEAALQLQVLQRLMRRLSLEITFEGSISLGELGLADHSWSFTAGNSGSLRILSKPALLRRSVSDLVSFLNMLPVGQALVLKPNQDLFIEGLSSDAMLDYYQFCQDNKEPEKQEKGQDELFAKACPTLPLKALNLRVYAVNATQMDRNIDVNAKGILFRAVGNNEQKASALVVALLA